MKNPKDTAYFVSVVRRKGVGQICVGHINIEINKVSNTVSNPFLHVESIFDTYLVLIYT